MNDRRDHGSVSPSSLQQCERGGTLEALIMARRAVRKTPSHCQYDKNGFMAGYFPDSPRTPGDEAVQWTAETALRRTRAVRKASTQNQRRVAGFLRTAPVFL